MFKLRYSTVKIGFSKFCTIRPKWCIMVDSSGSHSVCICAIHQNVKLLIDAMGINVTYKDLMAMIVCSLENRICMIHRCANCPGNEPLMNYLISALAESEEEIVFKQWESTDSYHLLTQSLSVNDFMELLVKSIDKLTSHSYTAKCQARYLKQRKENLTEESIIILGDFAENYTFVVQDEIQSFHWSKISCTLHPIVIYYKEN